MLVKNIYLNENSSKAFDELLEMNLPITISWKISKIAKKINELAELKGETINNLITKHSEKDENGKAILAEDENGKPIPNAFKIANIDEYKKDLLELNNIENQLDFEPISVTLIQEKNENIKPSIFFNLSYLFVD